MNPRDGVLLSQFLFLLFLGSTLSAPKEVRLGGLFPLFRINGEVIANGQQRMAGFLLAVKEINDANVLLPNIPIKVVVKDTKLNVGETFFSTLDMVTKSFKKRGIDACIGAQSSVESDAAATVLSQFSKTQVSYSSTSALLSTKLNSPYFARTCPSDIFQGAAMAALVAKNYGW